MFSHLLFVDIIDFRTNCSNANVSSKIIHNKLTRSRAFINNFLRLECDFSK